MNQEKLCAEHGYNQFFLNQEKLCGENDFYGFDGLLDDFTTKHQNISGFIYECLSQELKSPPMPRHDLEFLICSLQNNARKEHEAKKGLEIHIQEMNNAFAAKQGGT